jgi:two-component system copper resistance phosphate regulon response regulator CusR
MRILLIEDDVRLQKVLVEGFRDLGEEVVVAGTFREGFDQALIASWAVVILDIGLPDGSGVELCARLRKAGVETPILMLTARDTLDDKVTGLEAGADDYLVKPFAFRELRARVEALARRRPALAPETVKIADLEVDLRSHEVRRNGTAIELTAKEFALLDVFVRNEGAVLDRATITAHVWDASHDPLTNALEVLVRRLRAKIDEGFEPKLIHTVRGAGYRFGT